MYTNIMKMLIFLKMKYNIRSNRTTFYAMERLRNFLTFKFSDLMISLTYILMNNFGPCFDLAHQTFIIKEKSIV